MTERRKGITSLMHNYDFEHASFEGTNHFMVTTRAYFTLLTFARHYVKRTNMHYANKIPVISSVHGKNGFAEVSKNHWR